MSPGIIRHAEEQINNEKRLRAWKIKYQIRQLMDMNGNRDTIKTVQIITE